MSRALPQLAKTTAATQARALSGTHLMQSAQGPTLLQDKQNGFGFARSNPRPDKPRSKGVTEIRGPYYTVRRTKKREPLSQAHFDPGHGETLLGRCARDVGVSPMPQIGCLTHCSRMGTHVDGLKFAGG